MVNYKFKRSSGSFMNITPRIKSARSPNRLVVNFSIEIPLKSKYLNPSYLNSQSSSPNHRKKYKLVPTPNHEKRTANTSNLNTLRDLPNYHVETKQSHKKQTAPTPYPSSRAFPTKVRSTQLSPRRKNTSRKSKQGQIVRNISILQQVVNEQDNIIKYTTGSNQLKEIYQGRLKEQKVKDKMNTHISEVDIIEIRTLENEFRSSRESQHSLRIKDILRIACAKKIQRAWRRYKTKKLIKSYSSDIRKKQLKTLEQPQQYSLFSARSQGGSLKLKKNILQIKNEIQMQAAVKTQRASRPNKAIQKFQEESIEKWQQMLQKIKNQKNIDKLLQISLQRSQTLRNQLDQEQLSSSSRTRKEKSQFFQEKRQEKKLDKIIKTKGYYEQERQKRRQIFDSKTPNKAEDKTIYFQNQILKIQNDLSDISVDSSRLQSVQSDTARELQQLENIKLRKKLEVFKEHLPEMASFQPYEKEFLPSTNGNRRIDINELLKKKNKSELNKQQKQQNKNPIQFQRAAQAIQIKIKSQSSHSDLCQIQQQIQSSVSDFNDKIIQTHRQWKPSNCLEQPEQLSKWKKRLQSFLKLKQLEIITVIFEQLVLQSLIQISQSDKLIGLIKHIYQNSKKDNQKPQGIVTSHASIRDYLNYFINYIYEFKVERLILSNLLKGNGPSPTDILKYFRGVETNSESDQVMNIKIFNDHWKYANDLIYFDPKFPKDPAKQNERVLYLKQLTKVFFRAIFDCFNQSLQLEKIFGATGKAYPWSLQNLNPQVPSLKKSLSNGFQRVIKLSTVFCGVHFADKQHNLDRLTMQEIQQQNMVKLITMELNQDEYLWNFFEDQLVEIKLSLASYVQELIIQETVKVLAALRIKY